MAKKYCKILEEVEAVQAKGDNLEELRAIGGDVKAVMTVNEESKVYYYTVPACIEVLWIGGWLIKHKNGRLEIKSNRLFNQEYEPK